MANAKTTDVTLEEPIKRGDDTITKVTIRKPKAGELRGVLLAQLMAMEVGSVATVLGRTTNPVLTPPEIDDLEATDLMQMASAVVGFFYTDAEKAAVGMPTAKTTP